MIGKLGLGTVQFGLDYGISNRNGQVSRMAVKSILAKAEEAGVGTIDTASRYGDSERVLGECMKRPVPFRVVSKTPPISGESVTRSEAKYLDQALETSLSLLGIDRLYGLLVHHPSDLLKEGGEQVRDFLLNAKDSGRVERIGVSVYSAEDIDRIVEIFQPDIVQAPISIADQRLVKSGHVAAMKSRNIEIHARSIFLQGLLLQSPAQTDPYFEPVRAALLSCEEYLRDAGVSKLEACLWFALGRHEIDTVLVGVTSLEELDDILNAAAALGRSDLDFDQFQIDDENILNPSNWPPIH
jgi:aryl-alcohol dehydrogenase-like predicted oxidoreductase